MQKKCIICDTKIATDNDIGFEFFGRALCRECTKKYDIMPEHKNDLLISLNVRDKISGECVYFCDLDEFRPSHIIDAQWVLENLSPQELEKLLEKIGIAKNELK